MGWNSPEKLPMEPDVVLGALVWTVFLSKGPFPERRTVPAVWFGEVDLAITPCPVDSAFASLPRP